MLGLELSQLLERVHQIGGDDQLQALITAVGLLAVVSTEKYLFGRGTLEPSVAGKLTRLKVRAAWLGVGPTPELVSVAAMSATPVQVLVVDSPIGYCSGLGRFRP